MLEKFVYQRFLARERGVSAESLENFKTRAKSTATIHGRMCDNLKYTNVSTCICRFTTTCKS